MTKDPILLCLCLFLLCLHGVAETNYASSCSATVCNGTTIRYPFWRIDDGSTTGGSMQNSYCGYPGFGLSCPASNYTYPTLTLPTDSYYITAINYAAQSISLVDIDVLGKTCPRAKHNVTIDSRPLVYNPGDVNITFYFNCSFDTAEYPPPPVSPITCLEDYYSAGRTSYVVLEGTPAAEDFNWTAGGCEEVVVATVKKTEVTESELISQFAGAMSTGFSLDWNTAKECGPCEQSGGLCGFNNRTGELFCYCEDGSLHTNQIYCKGKTSGYTIKIGLAVFGGATVFTVLITIYLCQKLKPKLFKGRKSDRDVENFIKQHGSIAPKRFRYSQVKRMTDSFRGKLGEGGFGAVYSGKLPDGTLVAVKLLNASKGNGEDFINEVASISRTSHINIVTLLGFCYEGHRRALIYEFMSKGSLDRFIADENALTSGTGLGWEKLYQISVGIARGLEYLHRGCNTRILHFDIKPQNILLDDELNPKISDFGLSKLCLNRESIVSVLMARGTIGYIAPEVFSRNFGAVSHKSDVYSFGMVLLEMVGGRKKDFNAVADRSSEMYFHDQVYQLIEEEYDQVLYGQLPEEEKQAARKMAMVGIWCIQADPKQRPSMGKVIEMLEGSVDALPTPPKPFLFSPPRSQINSLSIGSYGSFPPQCGTVL